MITREMLPTLHSVVRGRAIRGSIYSLLIWGVLNLGFWYFLGGDDRRFFNTLPRADTDIFVLANGGAIIGASMLLLGGLGALIRRPAVLLFDGISLFLVGAWNIGFDFYAGHVLQRYGYTIESGVPIWIVLGASQMVWGLRQLSHYGKVSSWRGAAVPRHEVEQFKRALSAWVKQPQDAAAGRLKASISLKGIVPQTENYAGTLDSACAIFVSQKVDNCFVVERSAALAKNPGNKGELRLATDAGMKSVTFEPLSLAAFQRWAGGHGAEVGAGSPGISPLKQMGDTPAVGVMAAGIAARAPEAERRQAAAKRSTGNLGDWLVKDGSAEKSAYDPTAIPLQDLTHEPPAKSAAEDTSKRDPSRESMAGGLAEWVKQDKEAPSPPVEAKDRAPRPHPAAPSGTAERLVEKPAAAEAHAAGKALSNEPAIPSPVPVTRPLPQGIYAHFVLVDIASPVREIRGVPRYLPVKETPTLLGRYEKAHIHLDDPATVHLKHATVDLQKLNDKPEFIVRPFEGAPVTVNDKSVDAAGVALKSEDRIQIGSARLIFFQTNLNVNSKDWV